MSWENYKSDTSGDVMVGKFEVFIDMNKSKGNQNTGGRSKGVPSMSGNIVVPEKLNSNSNWSDTSLDQSPLDFLLDDEFNLNSTHNLEMAIKNITNPSPEHDIGKLKGRDVLLSQTISNYSHTIERVYVGLCGALCLIQSITGSIFQFLNFFSKKPVNRMYHPCFDTFFLQRSYVLIINRSQRDSVLLHNYQDTAISPEIHADHCNFHGQTDTNLSLLNYTS